MSAAKMTAALDCQLANDFRMRGFKNIKPRLWVSFEKEPIRQLLQFFPVRYNAYLAGWGFALSFCPALRGDGKLAWKRTEKATRWDLWVDPCDNPGLDISLYGISYSTIKSDDFGRVHVVEPEFVRVKEVCHAAIGQASKLFASVVGYADLARLFEEIPSRKSRRFGPDNYIPHGLAWGLTLIAAGDKANGLKRINGWRAAHKVNTDDRVLNLAIEAAEQCGAKPEYMQ